MDSKRRRVCAFLLMMPFAQSVWAQSPSTKDQGNSLPADKTPEEILALVALNFGVKEYHNGSDEKAIRYFIEAKRLDPNLLNARLYLATAYASRFEPAVLSEANQKRAENAVAEFRDVLILDSQNISAIDGLGSIRFKMAGAPFSGELFLESKSYFQKHIQLRVQDVEPYYWVGAIDWTLAFHANKELRERFNKEVGKLDPADPLPPELRASYEQDCTAIIEEGIQSLDQAIKLKPDYDDAMAYLSLLYRRKADVTANEEERKELLRMADNLVERVKEIKEARVKQLERN